MDKEKSCTVTRKKRWYRKRTRDNFYRKAPNSDASTHDSDSEGSSSDSGSLHQKSQKRKCTNESDSSSSQTDDGRECSDQERQNSDISLHGGNPDANDNTSSAGEERDHNCNDEDFLNEHNEEDQAGNENQGIDVNDIFRGSEGDQNTNDEDLDNEQNNDQDRNQNEGNDVNDRVPAEENPQAGNVDILNPVDRDIGNSAGEDESGGGSESDENGSQRETDSERDSSQGEEEDEEEENEDIQYENQPIFNGAQITFRESMLTILTFALSHKLTGLCLKDLLALIELHCGPNNLCLKTLHKFKTYFKMIGKSVIICHYFCSVCQVPLETKDSVCETCAGQHNVDFFIEFPIIRQLESMFARSGFYESLQFRFNRAKKGEANIEEIYDGLIYQDLVNDGFLANPNNLSFFMYFDGISLFKSSCFQLWPVYLTINELKYRLRSKKENMILAGLWFGKSKPNPNLFLQPIHDTLSMLETEGVDLTLPNADNVRVKAKLIGAVGDMPAKSAFMRFTQYNGAFSCFSCMSHGGRYDLGNTTVQVYPYSRNIEIRNNDDIPDFARQAVIARQNDPQATVYGVKGPSLLSAMLPNMILCLPIDVMHGVFLGAMKTLMNLWFDSQYSALPFSISAFVHIVDIRLKVIKAPSSFTRGPRSLKKELSILKAADFKIFMFYYSLPVLLGILPERYWLHHRQLVTAIAILCQESITLQEIDAAEELMHSYISEFLVLYGLRHLSLTFHQLLHLPMFVKNLGPTWVFSCFFYESMNGQLARLVHGSRYVALQICSASYVFMNLSVLVNSMNEGAAKALCFKFQQSTKQEVKITENIDNKTDVVGKMKMCYPVPGWVRRLTQESFNVNGGRFKTFFRLRKKGVIYCSETYRCCKERVSCFAEIYDNGNPYLCKILSFYRWSACRNCPLDCAECPKVYFCIVALYDRIMWEMHDNAPQNIALQYLNKVSPLDDIRAFPVESIRSVCLYMPIDGKEYICVPVNTLEIE